MTLREYLSHEARRITDRSLADLTDADAWRSGLPERRQRFLEMMGLDTLPPYDQRPPLNVTVTGVVERPAYRIEKLHYESLPNLYVTANLYVPKPGAEGIRQREVSSSHPHESGDLALLTCRTL
jgi:hypothetical protein